MITYLRATNSLAIGSRTYPRGELAPNVAPDGPERRASPSWPQRRTNQAPTRALADRKHPRRRAVRGTQQTADRGQAPADLLPTV